MAKTNTVVFEYYNILCSSFLTFSFCVKHLATDIYRYIYFKLSTSLVFLTIILYDHINIYVLLITGAVTCVDFLFFSSVLYTCLC